MYYLYKRNYQAEHETESEFLQQCDIKVLRPGIKKLFLKEEKKNIKTAISRIYFWLITGGKYEIYYLCHEGKIAHHSFVVPKCFKFPFLENDDYEIGPCVTEQEYRRRGCYHYILKYITSREIYKNAVFYMLVKENNEASVKGIEKSGFFRAGCVEKTRFLKRYTLENSIEGWYYYKYAMLPTIEPHKQADVSSINDGRLWKQIGKKALFARWTSDFDCKQEKNWWYVIKDTPFDIQALKAKRRYVIHKGKKYFDVCRIDPTRYVDDILAVQTAAYSVYPEKYRPKVEAQKVRDVIYAQWQNKEIFVYGAFFKETGQLQGYAVLKRKDECIEFSIQKVHPEYEKYEINAALVSEVMNAFAAELDTGFYIYDGERNIQHETAFQDYLEKYFGFRKAYCQLHIAYRPGLKWLVKCLYLFRTILKKLDGISIVHKVNGVLQMEAILRE